MNKQYAYARLPRTGLCNMLNVWARAFLWAKDSGAQMIEPQWVQLNRIGPILRGERDKRFYFGMFSSDYVRGVKKSLLLTLARSRVRFFEGQGKDILELVGRNRELRDELLRIASPQVRERLSTLPQEFVAVHIRRGDFKGIGRTLPGEYYVRGVRCAVERRPTLPILVFSDGTKEELDFLKDVGDVYARIRFMSNAPALHDVLALSCASIFVCTNGSSFSEWGAFLGGMPTIWSGDPKAFPIVDAKVPGGITRI